MFSVQLGDVQQITARGRSVPTPVTAPSATYHQLLVSPTVQASGSSLPAPEPQMVQPDQIPSNQPVPIDQPEQLSVPQMAAPVQSRPVQVPRIAPAPIPQPPVHGPAVEPPPRCCVCMENYPTVMFLACQQICICRECLYLMQRSRRPTSDRLRCPACNILSAYISGYLG